MEHINTTSDTIEPVEPIVPVESAVPAVAIEPIVPVENVTSNTMDVSTPTPIAIAAPSVIKIQFFLKGMNGKTSVIECASDDEVSKIRLLVAEKENIAPENQRLIFSGRQLEDGHCISEYGVQNNSTVFLVIRMKG
jgi:hypothetical protein